MLNFIYDSLETVKGLKFPGVKVYTTLTLTIFAIVIVAGLYFILADAIFGELYQSFYDGMSATAGVMENVDQNVIVENLTGTVE